jgi:hypothetical protein
VSVKVAAPVVVVGTNNCFPLAEEIVADVSVVTEDVLPVIPVNV